MRTDYGINSVFVPGKIEKSRTEKDKRREENSKELHSCSPFFIRWQKHLSIFRHQELQELQYL